MDLTEDEARWRFAESRSAVLATADADGVPHAVPVTFVVRGTHVCIAIDAKPKRVLDPLRLKRLRNIAANPRVCLLAEHYADDWTQLWWVRADGVAVVRDLDPLLLEAFRNRYPFYRENAPAGPVIDVDVATWTGWAFTG